MSYIVCQDIGNCNITDLTIVRRILVPFDNSRHAPNVFGFALTIAKLVGASLTVASVVNKDLVKSWVNGTPSRERALSLNC